MIDNPGIPLVNNSRHNHTSGDSGINNNSNINSSNNSFHSNKHKHYGSAQHSAASRMCKYENVGCRLAQRKLLFTRRRLLADLSLGVAIAGMCLMIIKIELCFANVIPADSAGSVVLRSAITIATIVLLAFVVWYHWVDARIFMIDNSMEDWRLAATPFRLCRLALELVTCWIHPFPWIRQAAHTEFEEFPFDGFPSRSVPLEIWLCLAMFLRLYLVCRVMLLHSKLFQDASSQSLGALNRVPFNFRFIFKSLMNLYPEYVLTVLASSLFVLATWAIRACEMHYGEGSMGLLNSMWLTAITFLTVGYGDIVPHSYCGRGIAVITGIFGAGMTALVVAVLARKLELSRAEKYVHNFVIDIEIDKQVKHVSANILKEGWLSYKYRKCGNASKMLRHQRRLLHAIHSIRQLREDQKRLIDSSISLTEMHKNQCHLMTSFAQLQTRCRNSDDRLMRIEQKLDRLLQMDA